MRRIAELLVPAVTVLLVAAGCSSTSSTSSTSPSSTAPVAQSSAVETGSVGSSEASPTLAGELTIFAAASLKKGFDQLRTQFQDANPGVTVKDISYDGSSGLVTQIQGGAQPDVFASADTKNMDKLKDMVAGTPQEFATNTLQIAVAPGNPKGITSLDDLAKSGVTVVLCASEVPCGNAAHTALDAAGVKVTPVSEEQNVAAVATKVASGDADAGLIYKTDVLASAGRIEGVGFPEASKAVNHYPIAVLTDAKNPDAAAAFIALVLSPDGQQTLADLGFGKPGA